MSSTLKSALLALTLLVPALALQAAEEPRPYGFGPVTNVAYIRTKPGGFDKYMAYLAGNYKKLMEEYMKAGLVVSYKVYQTEPRSPSDPDLILTVTYKNWATLDGLVDKTEPLDAKVFGSLPAADKASVDRGALREELGSQTIQELTLR